jgi:hypothetical protein
MGTPWMGFMKDEFGWGKVKGALSFGGLALIMGLPTVLFFQYGYFDEYDYWAGTVSLVVFALLEIILFAWVFGMTKGWEEITRGADIKIPVAYRFIIKYITPVLLLMVFIGALFTPKANEWAAALSGIWENNGWALDNSSLISKISLADLKAELALNPDKKEFIENKMFFTQMARIQLLLLFVFISIIVWFSTKKRKLAGRL